MRGDLLVCGGDVLTPGARITADVVVRGGRIAAVVLPGAVPTGTPPDIPVLDATDLVVAPGLIDLQCNGLRGFDLTARPEDLWAVSAALPRWGVTAWVPTIVTSPDAVRERAIAALRAGPSNNGLHARPLGLHFEGPYLNPERSGAHAVTHLRSPDRDAVAGWSHDAGVALVTLAPELPGADGMLRDLVDRGVVVSMGHSSATVAEATAAVDAGARGVTHMFNSMGPLHHREPGLIGVALTDERLSVGLIGDGLHVDPMIVSLASRALKERLMLVTDAVAAMGMPPGRWALGDVESIAGSDGVRLADGTLAGSLLSLDQAVANLVAFTGASLDKAVAAASLAPARLLGLDDERGSIVPASVGDFALLDVRDGVEVAVTVIGGEVAYRRDDPDAGGEP
jgi:N-acetylglucosamine-6-phosphate deacetylase